MIDAFIKEMFDTALASIFDPEPIRFTGANEKGVPVVRRLMSLPPSRHTLRRKLARNAFLCGCLDVTEGETREHLLIGFGRRGGNTTWIREVDHQVGTANSVHVPPSLENAIERHLAGGVRTEVLVFHSHPLNGLNILLDNVPLPSSTDRETLVRMRYAQPLVALRAFLGHGNIRFFLGENGFVREFTTPGVVRMLAEAQRLGIIRVGVDARR